MTKRAISLAKFNELGKEMQLNALQKNGVNVGKREQSGQIVVLYQLHGFYVEIYYKTYRKVVDALITSESSDILHPYLDQINVRDLDKGKKKR
jgi:hypothetical protein